MSFNTFGHLFRFTTWGESHGPAVGCVVDGVPPRLPLEAHDIQKWLDRRRPGQSRHTTQRKESDKVKVLSGVFENQTTGAPIAMMIRNEDTRTKDYEAIKDSYRPGHADYTYDVKYGVRDWRGGGRSSARETAARVAAGAIARKFLGEDVTIHAALVELGGIAIDRAKWDWAEVENNAFWCPDATAVPKWEEALDAARKDGDSLGAIVEVVAYGAPAGIGAPHYAKLDQDLASALMSIHAAKGVEIGAGFAAARIRGSDNADQMRMGEDGTVTFLSNRAGGVLGGISTGQPVLARVAFKPTSSINKPMQTVTADGQNTEISTTGRHDPCVGIRGAPVAEAMMALVLADHMLLHQAQCGWEPA